MATNLFNEIKAERFIIAEEFDKNRERWGITSEEEVVFDLSFTEDGRVFHLFSLPHSFIKWEGRVSDRGSVHISPHKF